MSDAEIIENPVIKVGALVLRNIGTAIPEVLIIKPKPKKPGEDPGFVLPRGTRQYSVHVNGQTEWHDAREMGDAIKNIHTLEPFYRALQREIKEEAGVDGAMLARAQEIELGVRQFQSRTKGQYPIHWFVVVPAAQDAQVLTRIAPEDTLEMRWASLATVNEMSARGEFSKGYLPVIEEALAMRIALDMPHEPARNDRIRLSTPVRTPRGGGPLER